MDTEENTTQCGCGLPFVGLGERCATCNRPLCFDCYEASKEAGDGYYCMPCYEDKE